MNDSIRIGLGFILYLLAQVMIFNHLELFQVAVPFVFLIFILTLPLQISRVTAYLLAFAIGFCVDIFSEHSATGLHAFATVLIVPLRSWWAGVVGSTGTRGLDDIEIQQQSALFYALYLFPLIFLHQITYFILEDFTFQRFFYNFWKASLGTIYTFTVGFLITYIFYKR